MVIYNQHRIAEKTIAGGVYESRKIQKIYLLGRYCIFGMRSGSADGFSDDQLEKGGGNYGAAEGYPGAHYLRSRVRLSDDSYLQPGSGSSDTAGRKDEAVEKDQ